MKVTNAHLRIAILVLAGILIGYAVLKLLFNLDLGPEVEKNLPTVVMVGAAGIFLWNRQIYARDQKEQAAEEARKAEEEAAKAEDAGAGGQEDPPSPKE